MKTNTSIIKVWLIFVCITALLGRFAATQTSFAKTRSNGGVVQMDRHAFHGHLKTLGYKRRGGISKAKTESSDKRFRSLQHFSSSFRVDGVTYPYTMLGYPPPSGRQAVFRSVIVPLRMNFVGFGPNQDMSVTFDPSVAVTNIVNSPIYQARLRRYPVLSTS
jgi:hypothetical protein